MAIYQYISPKGTIIVGTAETSKGRADIEGIDPGTGEPEYTGWTRFMYENQRTETRDGKILFLDEEGYEWTFDQLTPVGEVDERSPFFPPNCIDGDTNLERAPTKTGKEV
jgi:hypothetical protein